MKGTNSMKSIPRQSVGKRRLFWYWKMRSQPEEMLSSMRHLGFPLSAMGSHERVSYGEGHDVTCILKWPFSLMLLWGTRIHGSKAPRRFMLYSRLEIKVTGAGSVAVEM